jgi:hypothetical protein
MGKRKEAKNGGAGGDGRLKDNLPSGKRIGKNK